MDWPKVALRNHARSIDGLTLEPSLHSEQRVSKSMESKVGRDEALQRGTRGVIEAREGEDKAPGEMNCHSSEDVFDACTADRGGCKSEGRLVG